MDLSLWILAALCLTAYAVLALITLNGARP